MPLLQDVFGNPVPFLTPTSSQTLDCSNTVAVRSAVLSNGIAVQITANAAVWMKSGNNSVTANTNHHFLAANTPYVFSIGSPANSFISVKALAANATVYISELN